MSLVKTWYDLDAAVAKFGLDKFQLQSWIEEGLIRYEEVDGEVARVNIDDVRLEVEALVRRSGGGA